MRRTALLIAAALLAPTADAGWKLKKGKTKALSVPTGGPPAGDHASNLASISGDGRLVCFVSDVAALTGHGAYPERQVVVHDRQTGVRQLVSATAAGAPMSYTPTIPVISADGRYVVFSTYAPDLPDGISVSDVAGHRDVFRTHLPTGTTIRVSVTYDGKEPDDDCIAADVSADGRYVLFTSKATNLLPVSFVGPEQVYRIDLNSFTITRVSMTQTGTRANADCDDARISADGQTMIFRTAATNLGVVPAPNRREIWLRDLHTGALEFVSGTKGGAGSEKGADRAVLSGDGRYVAFSSYSSDLPGAQSGDVPGLFVRDRKKEKTWRAPVSGKKLFSITPNDASDGRYVSFTTDRASGFRVHVWDVKKGKVKEVGLNSKGKRGNASSHRAALSADGKDVVFDSKSTNLGGDGDGAADVFVRRWK